MNFSQMHERLRLVCLHTIRRGDLTMAELSRQTGLSKSHVSKFLHAHGQISNRTADCILRALHLKAEYLLDFGPHLPSRGGQDIKVPLVSHSAALFEPEIGPHAVEIWLSVPHKELPPPGPRRASLRQSWRRFIAIRINHDGAQSLGRPEYDGAIAVIDRHYGSLRLYYPNRSNLYAIREDNQVMLRYIDRVEAHLVIRPANIDVPAGLIYIPQTVKAAEYIAGRVALIQHKT